ncbi:MAG: hypothetical protein KY450_09480 [Actinobacteria bacterium]|nr:hypothetical protein [Actinomycetota bacterium]
MKRTLVAISAFALALFGGGGSAWADPAATARASAYGADVGGSLLGNIIEREPEVTSVLPPGGLVSEAILNIPADPLVINGTGVVIAETSAESTIVPFMGSGEGAAAPGGGLGGDPAGLLGGVLEGVLGGGGGGGGLPVGAVQTQQLGGDGGGGLLGGTLGGDLLGGLLDQGTDESGELVADNVIDIPLANARGFARIDDLNLVVEEADFGALPTEVVAVLVDALLEIDAVSAEAVAVCAANQVFFDTAASVLAVNDEGVELVDQLVETLGDLLPEVLSIDVGEVGVTPDGQGVFVNALHIQVLGAIDDTLTGVTEGDGGDGGGDGGTLGGITETVTGDGGGGDGGADVGGTDPEGENTVGVQQLTGGDDGDGGGLLGGGDGDEPLLDIVIGHAEVSATECAPQVAPPTSLTPTGDAGPSLPRTGGLGILPGLVGVGLLGGALTAGRLALRSRRGDS